MKICEIFSSIQGESSYAGIPCTFIRTTGCNLRCSYCDTVYAYGEGSELTEDEIMEKVHAMGLRTIEITGGEPLLQAGVFSLAKRLLDHRFRVLIETNGSQSIRQVDQRAVLIPDVKTPGSGMANTFLMSNLDHLRPVDELKFVITGREDYEWSRNFVKEHSLTGRCAILFSPAFGILHPKDLTQWIMEERLEVRLNLQLHKYIYGADARAV
ncbi:MAG TPA: radical SAM protein [Thermodesulfovibrionales bacterium]|nr:radical SAM protein [Thermodesulfovibrionales bacterium]